jgi:hypothetical protein
MGLIEKVLTCSALKKGVFRRRTSIDVPGFAQGFVVLALLFLSGFGAWAQSPDVFSGFPGDEPGGDESNLRAPETHAQALEEVERFTPKREAWDSLVPAILENFTSDHAVLMGPGFRSNSQLTAMGQGTWVLSVQSKHFLIPNHSPADVYKWALLLGSHMQLTDRSEDLTLQLRVKAPMELWFSDSLQLRLLLISDLLRKARWDLEPDLPFPETRTLRVALAPQLYLQTHVAEWLQLRVGMPLRAHLPLTRTFGLFDQTLSTHAGFVETGPAVYANAPFSAQFRVKVGGGYILRYYSQMPTLSDLPLRLTHPSLNQNYVRLTGLAEYHAFQNLIFWVKSNAFFFRGNEGIYDFNAYSLRIETQWTVGSFRLLPHAELWARSFSRLTYPNDTLTALGNILQGETFVSLGIQGAHEIGFQNFESLFLTLTLDFQTFTNAYNGSRASTLAALKKASNLDVLMGFGLFL